MENNINEPLMISEIAQHVKLQSRTLERLFKIHLQISPKEYYLKLRLTHAQNLLKQSTLSISNIAFACGFVVPLVLLKPIKLFNYSPKFERNVLDFAN